VRCSPSFEGGLVNGVRCQRSHRRTRIWDFDAKRQRGENHELRHKTRPLCRLDMKNSGMVMGGQPPRRAPVFRRMQHPPMLRAPDAAAAAACVLRQPTLFATQSLWRRGRAWTRPGDAGLEVDPRVASLVMRGGVRAARLTPALETSASCSCGERVRIIGLTTLDGRRWPVADHALAGFTARPAIQPWSGPRLVNARCGRCMAVSLQDGLMVLQPGRGGDCPCKRLGHPAAHGERRMECNADGTHCRLEAGDAG
jgi:hypothetical protein